MLQKGLLLLAIALAILTLGKFLFWSFPLELLTHFQVHYLLLTIALISISIWLRRSQKIKSQATLFILLFALAVNIIELGTWYFPEKRIAPSSPNILRVMSFNINVDNVDANRTVGSIKFVDPDLILIIEVDPVMKNKIETSIGDLFPYSFRSPGGGMAVFSKLPLTDSSGKKFSGSNDTNLVTHIKYRNRQIQIIGTHPLVPVKANLFVRRNLHLNSIATHLARESQPTILMGDFNLTPWSPYYRQFIDRTKLHNTRLGFGILPTWIRPSTNINRSQLLLLPILNIPIDHIFVSKDFTVARTYTGDNGNSDHAPIISELVIS
jgi:endonuclease/exonuclease/phosphatase (EEP) superfamily protein YafD